jgi:hypothetical protein
MRRVSAVEHTREDLLLLIKIVAVVGIALTFSPWLRYHGTRQGIVGYFKGQCLPAAAGRKKVAAVVSTKLDQRMKQKL